MEHKPYGPYETYFKRPLDILCALAALIVFGWLYILVAVLVRIKLGSPVIFKQPRPGRDEKIFDLYKFRSMTDERDENGEIVMKRGKPVSDTALRDTENVPLVQDIDAYFAQEVLPYAPDAWIDKSKTKVGYEIPMTRYFYEYQPLEPVDDIVERIQKLEREIADSLNTLFHKEG